LPLLKFQPSYFTTTLVALNGWMMVKVNWKGRE